MATKKTAISKTPRNSLIALARELAKDEWIDATGIDFDDWAPVVLAPGPEPRFAYVMAWVCVDLPPGGTR